MFLPGNHRSVGIFRAREIFFHPEQSVYVSLRRRRFVWMRMCGKLFFDSLVSEHQNNSVRRSYRTHNPGRWWLKSGGLSTILARLPGLCAPAGSTIRRSDTDQSGNSGIRESICSFSHSFVLLPRSKDSVFLFLNNASEPF